jgi:hypothetical protein
MSAEKEPRSQPAAISVAMVAGVITAILRVVPHPPNFSSVGALGLFGGARLPAWKAYTFPLGVLILSDLILWVCTGFDPNYSLGHLSRSYVYASFMIYVFIGRWLADKNSIRSIVIVSTAGALQFFILTNFCEWLFQPLMQMPDFYRYSRGLDGLVACYIAALGFTQNDSATVLHPFMMFTDFRLGLPWMILGDIFFTTAYLWLYAKLVQRDSQPQPTTMPATHA